MKGVPQMTKLRIDCHVHTCYSHDSQLSLDSLVGTCRAKGIDGICVTDHNTIAGAAALAKHAPFPVVVGEEILTAAGEIIGYFLSREVPGGLSPQATVAAIKDQGGLVAIPHPFDRMRHSALKSSALTDIAADVDIIEVYNSHTFWPADNQKALQFSEKYSKAVTAGSDCHSAKEAGYSFVTMDPFQGADEFLEQLRAGELCCRPLPLRLHFLRLLSLIQR